MAGQPARSTTIRRRNRKIEHGLQAEVVWKLKAAGIFYIPVPNGVYIPDLPASWMQHFSEPQQAMAKLVWQEMKGRIINAMKAQGLMDPGALDLVLVGKTGRAGLCELKIPGGVDLLGNRIQPGRLNTNQNRYIERATSASVPCAVCHSWDEVLAFWKTL